MTVESAESVSAPRLVTSRNVLGRNKATAEIQALEKEASALRARREETTAKLREVVGKISELRGHRG